MSSDVILLVEDNPSDVALTRRALERNRIHNELVVATDGREALDYLFGEGSWQGRDTSRQPAVVLLDLNLPRIDGLSVLRTVRSDPRTGRQPVVVLTSSVEDEDLAASYDLRVNSYIRKPVDFEKFLTAVGEIGMYWLLLNERPPGDAV